MLIHLIADYGYGDLAFAEASQRLAMLVPGAVLLPTPVPPFDTLSAGFCIAQLALTEGPSDRVIYHNVAPRGDQPTPRRQNEGERLAAARLDSGALVVGVNAGYTYSWLSGEVREIRYVDVPAAGSQFRSRDVFPRAVADLAAGKRDLLGEQLPDGAVPAPPERAVLYTDGYGNIKTSWTEAPAPTGERVRVTIGRRSEQATVSDGSFAVPEGEMAFAPGSSGWTRRGGDQIRFYELFLRGSSAAERLGHPAAGQRVEVTPLRGGARSAGRAG